MSNPLAALQAKIATTAAIQFPLVPRIDLNVDQMEQLMNGEELTPKSLGGYPSQFSFAAFCAALDEGDRGGSEAERLEWYEMAVDSVTAWSEKEEVILEYMTWEEELTPKAPVQEKKGFGFKKAPVSPAVAVVEVAKPVEPVVETVAEITKPVEAVVEQPVKPAASGEAFRKEETSASELPFTQAETIDQSTSAPVVQQPTETTTLSAPQTVAGGNESPATKPAVVETVRPAIEKPAEKPLIDPEIVAKNMATEEERKAKKAAKKVAQEAAREAAKATVKPVVPVFTANSVPKEPRKFDQNKPYQGPPNQVDIKKASDGQCILYPLYPFHKGEMSMGNLGGQPYMSMRSGDNITPNFLVGIDTNGNWIHAGIRPSSNHKFVFPIGHAIICEVKDGQVVINEEIQFVKSYELSINSEIFNKRTSIKSYQIVRPVVIGTKGYGHQQVVEAIRIDQDGNVLNSEILMFGDKPFNGIIETREIAKEAQEIAA